MKNLSTRTLSSILPFPVRTVVPTLSNGLRVGDVTNYKNLTEANKRKARFRVARLLMNIREDRRETSILPSYLILELWKSKVPAEYRNRFILIIKESFDGGSVFYIENKS